MSHLGFISTRSEGLHGSRQRIHKANGDEMSAWHDSLSKKHQARRANKFHAVKVKDSHGSFDSKAEREMHSLLMLMEKGGLVSNIRHHPPAVQLTRFVKWKVDWIVFDEKKKEDIYVEFKGKETERFHVILQLWPEFGPGRLQIWTKKGNRIFMYKELEGKK